MALLDYYHLRTASPCYGSKLKHMTNIKLNLAVQALRMIPFHFDSDCRKILSNLNSNQLINQAMTKILEKLQLDPIAQYLSVRELRQRNNNLEARERTNSVTSIKNGPHSISIKEKSKRAESRSKKLFVADMPRIPRKK